MNKKKIYYAKHLIDNNDIEAVKKVLKSSTLTQGNFVNKFEKDLSIFFKSRYATAVSSGTAALHLAGKILNWKKNDIIISSPLTFVASANSALYSNATVDFVDIDTNTYTIDPNKLESKIKLLKKKNKTLKTVICTDFAGHPCDWESIKYLSNKYNFTTINDNCHSMGSKYNNNYGYAVKYSDLVTHSYHPAKNFTTGEGGAILSNSKEYDKKAKLLRSHGLIRSKNQQWIYEMYDLGYNYRVTDFQCALGSSQLKKLKKYVNLRRNNAFFYNNSFINNDKLIIPNILNNIYHSFHFYPLLIKNIKNKYNKNNILHKLNKKNIYLQVHYTPIFLFEYYIKKKYINPKNFPETMNFFMSEISLPTYPGIKKYELKYIVDNITKLLK